MRCQRLVDESSTFWRISVAAAKLGPIVSSAHLAAGGLPALSELEFGLILASHAFHRWMVRCAAAAGAPGLSALEVLILHTVNHRGRAKRFADIALVLNVEDTHLVTYAVKKLEAAGLVAGERVGKEKAISVTAEGARVCARYHEVREALLIEGVKAFGTDAAELSKIATELRALSGLYDQAARAAASL
jgi:predicted MarR family transcription regulator